MRTDTLKFVCQPVRRDTQDAHYPIFERLTRDPSAVSATDDDVLPIRRVKNGDGLMVRFGIHRDTSGRLPHIVLVATSIVRVEGN